MGNKLRGTRRPKAAPLPPELQPKFQYALSLHQSGQFEAAQAAYRAVLKRVPGHFDSLHLMGVAASQAGNFTLGVQLIGDAIKLSPQIAMAHNNLANGLKELKQLDAAVEALNRAIGLDPNYADALKNRGNLLRTARRADAALRDLNRALQLDPNKAEIHNDIGVTLLELGRAEDALASLNRAIDLNPNFGPAYSNKSAVLFGKKMINEALECCNKAISLTPQSGDPYLIRGIIYENLGNNDAALEQYAHLNKLSPDIIPIYMNYASLFLHKSQYKEAMNVYERAFQLKSDSEYLIGLYVHSKMMLCDWRDLPVLINKLESLLLEGQPASPPLPVLALIDRPDLHKLCSENFTSKVYPDKSSPCIRRRDSAKIKIGYYSADFYNHATAILMSELFEVHNKEKFEIYAFVFGNNASDEFTTRISHSFDRYIDVNNMDDNEIAIKSRELGVDIAVDLKGYTKDLRLGIFSHRCAPVQVSYIGYPGTLGADYMDYVIADPIVIPKDQSNNYTEKIVQLPHSYQVNDSKRRISDRLLERSEYDLPEDVFVFCCFNNTHKILPHVYDIWMKLLDEIDNSVLWLLSDNELSMENLRREAEARGISGNRIYFAPRVKLDEHLARHRLADLFIDTLPYNAHTTASDALWAGLPVLTCAGQSFAARVAASLLNAVGMPELITHSLDEYEALALALARDPERLAGLKRKLEQNRLTTPLFDSKLFARHIEAAYEAMIARYDAGLPPDLIEIAP